MENKYYTPKIEEFYIGFEFEHYYEEGKLMKHPSNTNGWKSEIFDWAWSDIIYDDYEHNIEEISNNYRVKYLDKEDIESLGFVEIDYNKILYTEYLYLGTTKVFEKEDYKLYLRIEGNPIIDINMAITVLDKVRCTNEDLTYKEVYLFKGVIKNKSELITLLKQLNIDK